MKKVLVFYSFKSHKTGYIEMLFERLADEAKDRLELVRGSLKDLQISVVGGELRVIESLSGLDIRQFDAVYFELWYKAPAQALVASEYCKRHNIPFLSEELGNLIPMTKVGELAKLASHVPIPGSFTSSRQQILKAEKTGDLPMYPFVIKADDAYGGKCNFLIHNRKELREKLLAHKDRTFVVQEFIPNDFDYRCIVLGGEIRVLLRRQRSSGHLNNTSQGAEGVICDVSELSDVMRRDVLKAAEVVGRSSFAGVDLLVSNNGTGHYILEVNQTPQIEIGSNIETKMNAMITRLEEMTK